MVGTPRKVQRSISLLALPKRCHYPAAKDDGLAWRTLASCAIMASARYVKTIQLSPSLASGTSATLALRGGFGVDDWGSRARVHPELGGFAARTLNCRTKLETDLIIFANKSRATQAGSSESVERPRLGKHAIPLLSYIPDWGRAREVNGNASRNPATGSLLFGVISLATSLRAALHGVLGKAGLKVDTRVAASSNRGSGTSQDVSQGPEAKKRQTK